MSHADFDFVSHVDFVCHIDLQVASFSGEEVVLIYKMLLFQERKTQVPIPESPGEDYNLDVLDLGQHAQVGLLATDDQGRPVAGERYLRITTVAGDHTAVVHVEPGMWLNIDFNDTAVLSFDVKLYEVSVYVCVFDYFFCCHYL